MCVARAQVFWGAVVCAELFAGAAGSGAATRLLLRPGTAAASTAGSAPTSTVSIAHIYCFIFSTLNTQYCKTYSAEFAIWVTIFCLLVESVYQNICLVPSSGDSSNYIVTLRLWIPQLLFFEQNCMSYTFKNFRCHACLLVSSLYLSYL